MMPPLSFLILIIVSFFCDQYIYIYLSTSLILSKNQLLVSLISLFLFFLFFCFMNLHSDLYYFLFPSYFGLIFSLFSSS